MERPRSPEDWGKIYERARPTYVSFCERLKELLESQMDDERIPYWLAYVAVDRVDSFVQRLYRAACDGLHVDDPFEELPDFARLEVTAYSPDDVGRIETLLRVELEIDEERSTSVAAVWAENEHPSPRPGDDRLGYQTAKVVVSLPDTLARSWRGFGGLRAVIDIRTLMQEAWAAFDKNLPYYRHSSYPPEARRALEEAVARCLDADTALAAVRYEMDRADKRYAQAIDEGDLDLPLDTRSVRAYLHGSEVVGELVSIAEAAGMEPAKPDRSGWFLEQRMLTQLRRAGVGSISELDTLLRGGLERAGAIFADVVRLSKERDFQPYAVSGDVVVFLVIVLSRADAQTILLAEYASALDYALNTLIGNPLPFEAEEE
jgi:ppGpp synthetase/RelA/SpoT-type nucleotidyltranferase